MAPKTSKATPPRAALLEKEPTAMHEAFATWIEEETGYKPDLQSIQCAVVLRGYFQSSDVNQALLEQNRADREQELKDREEAKVARAEAKEAKEAERAEKAKEREEAKAAKAAEKAEKAETKTAAKPAPTKPAAKKTAAPRRRVAAKK